MAKGETSSLWIGLDDRNHEGTFRWEDGSLLLKEESNWSYYEPNNYRSIEDCTIMNKDDYWEWYDQYCNDRNRYKALCERLSNSMCKLFE